MKRHWFDSLLTCHSLALWFVIRGITLWFHIPHPFLATDLVFLFWVSIDEQHSFIHQFYHEGIVRCESGNSLGE